MPNVYHAVVDIVADLSGMTASHVTTKGKTVAGDGLGRQYVYNATGASGITADGLELILGSGADDYWESLNQDGSGSSGGMGYNIKSYGALDDGTDCTAAIQAAITAANAAGGGTVWVPDGDFTCELAHLFLYGNVSLKGNGRSSRILVKGDFTSLNVGGDTKHGAGFLLTGISAYGGAASPGWYDAEVSDLAFAFANATTIVQRYIHMTGEHHRVWFSNIFFDCSSPWSMSQDSLGTWTGSIDHVNVSTEMVDTSWPTQDHITIERCFVYMPEMYLSGIYTSSQGISVNAASNVTITDNVIWGCADDPIATHGCENVVIDSNRVYSVHGRIAVFQSLDCVVSNNYVERTSDAAGVFSAPVEMIVCRREGSTAYQQRSILITGNVIKVDEDFTDTETINAIRLQGVTHAIISNNLCDARNLGGLSIRLEYDYVWADTPSGVSQGGIGDPDYGSQVFKTRNLVISGNVMASNRYAEGVVTFTNATNMVNYTAYPTCTYVFFRTTTPVAYTAGDGTTPVAGDMVRDAQSPANIAVIYAVDVDTGTWAGTNATGTLYVRNVEVETGAGIGDASTLNATDTLTIIHAEGTGAKAYGYSGYDDTTTTATCGATGAESTLPAELVADRRYYPIADTADTFQLEEFPTQAAATTFSDDGTGTNVVEFWTNASIYNNTPNYPGPVIATGNCAMEISMQNVHTQLDPSNVIQDSNPHGVYLCHSDHSGPTIGPWIATTVGTGGGAISMKLNDVAPQFVCPSNRAFRIMGWQTEGSEATTGSTLTLKFYRDGTLVRSQAIDADNSYFGQTRSATEDWVWWAGDELTITVEPTGAVTNDVDLMLNIFIFWCQ